MTKPRLPDLVFGGDLFADVSAIAEHIHNVRCAWPDGYPGG